MSALQGPANIEYSITNPSITLLVDTDERTLVPRELNGEATFTSSKSSRTDVCVIKDNASRCGADGDGNWPWAQTCTAVFQGAMLSKRAA